MNATNAHKIRKELVKSSLAIVCLILFIPQLIPQLSYKFYLYANCPSWTFRVKSVHRRAHIAGSANFTRQYKHPHHPRIDKRYNLQPVIGWQPFSIGLTCGYTSATPIAVSPESGYPTASLPAHLLRGPPSDLPA